MVPILPSLPDCPIFAENNGIADIAYFADNAEIFEGAKFAKIAVFAKNWEVADVVEVARRARM